VLSAALTAIGEEAFYRCRKLETIDMAGTALVEIGDSAFYYCDSITAIVLPESLKVIGENAFYYCDGVESAVTLPSGLESIGTKAFYYSTLFNISVRIPASVKVIGEKAFYGCDLTVLVEAAEQPEDWHSDWDYDTNGVLWGFTGEEITYTFTEQVEEGTEAPVYGTITSGEPIALLPAPTKEGYYFKGWFDENGEQVTGSYYNSVKTTLYAQWMTEEEFLAQFAGTSFGYAIELNVGDVIVDEVEDDWAVYYKFTATESGYYLIESSSNTGNNNNPDMKLSVYDDPDSYGINYDDDSGEGYQFELSIYLEEGVTYYFVIESWSDTGSFTITFNAN
jgi:uncharacterized repeat protein (TIGR02543 family)